MNQHFVPRVYLKNLATKVKKEYFINTFDKKEKKCFRPSIKKFAQKLIFTLCKKTHQLRDILAVEKIYSDSIEPMYPKAYEILTNNEVFNITSEQRMEILLAILHLHMRNPKILTRALSHHSKEISNIYTEAITKSKKGLSYLDEDFSFREWSLKSIIEYFSENTTKEFKNKHLITTRNILNFHQFANIEVNITKGDSFFLTSDNPLGLEDFINRKEEPFLKSTEFVLPLNRRFAVKLYHDNTQEINNIRRGFIPNGNVNMINEIIFRQSLRFVFGEKSDFDQYHETQDFLNKDSFELRIDAIK
ncbi:MAG: DUF4238 domain-containing protein [Janthinobacterium lividum]